MACAHGEAWRGSTSLSSPLFVTTFKPGCCSSTCYKAGRQRRVRVL